MPAIPDKYDDTDFSILPDDVYVAKITEVKEGKTQKGDDKWNIKFEIIGDEEYGGRWVWDSFFFTEKAFKRLKILLKRLGVDVDGKGSVEESDVLGKIVKIETYIDSYDKVDDFGETQTRKINRITYGGFTALTDDELEKFSGDNESGDDPF